MRFALCYNILQARSLRDALVALDRTTANVREFVAWHAKYDFMAPGEWMQVYGFMVFGGNYSFSFVLKHPSSKPLCCDKS